MYHYICSLMNQELDLLTPSYVTGPQAMPSLSILIFIDYQAYGTL